MSKFSGSVTLPDGTGYVVHTLLGDGDSNVKLAKSDKAEKGFLTVGLSLSPAKESGYEMCGSRSPGCTRACLFTAGHGQMDNVRMARIAKTILFMEQRKLFTEMLFAELDFWIRKADRNGQRLACRLNIVSDVMWEKILPNLFNTFTNVQFYDYTKHVKRAVAFSLAQQHQDSIFFPLNYYLTFSRSEKNQDDVQDVICCSNTNVAVVFQTANLPAYYMGRTVINGDETDLRFLDPVNVIVGLKAKGKGRKDTSGFVVALPVIN